MKVQLRPLADSDVPLLAKWLYAPHVAPWFEHPQSWLNEVETRRTSFCWISHFIICADGAPIGFCQYYPYAQSGEDWQGDVPTEGAYSLDYLIGEAAYLRRGCAREALLQLGARIKAQPDAQRIIVQPDADNAASQNALRAAGYSHDAKNNLFLLVLQPAPAAEQPDHFQLKKDGE